MYPRTNYEMTEEQLSTLLAAMRPVPVMRIGNFDMSNKQQDSANRAWEDLGTKMGFDYMTVQPIPGKGQRFFSAVPSETKEALNERLDREALETKRQRITQLENDIKNLQAKLTEILA